MSQKFLCIVEKKVIFLLNVLWRLLFVGYLSVREFINWLFPNNAVSHAFYCVCWLFQLYLIIIFKHCWSHKGETVLTIVLSVVCFWQSGEIWWFISFPHCNLMISMLPDSSIKKNIQKHLLLTLSWACLPHYFLLHSSPWSNS